MPHDPAAEAAPHTLAWHLGPGPVAERQLIQQGYDDLGAARCPRCRAALVPRLGRAGPYFHCACPERPPAPTPQPAALPRQCA